LREGGHVHFMAGLSEPDDRDPSICHGAAEFLFKWIWLAKMIGWQSCFQSGR
jgi:hypothetical protein